MRILNKNSVVMAIDPSSKATGYCIATVGESLIEASVLTAKRTLGHLERTEVIIEGLRNVLKRTWPAAVIIELPSGRVHSRIAGRGSNLSIYGFAAGRIYQAMSEWISYQGTIPVGEAEWVKGRTKQTRARTVDLVWPTMKGLKDPGLDAHDAAALLLWWLGERKRKELENRT